jgi:hypothetical protein
MEAPQGPSRRRAVRFLSLASSYSRSSSSFNGPRHGLPCVHSEGGSCGAVFSCVACESDFKIVIYKYEYLNIGMALAKKRDPEIRKSTVGPPHQHGDDDGAGGWAMKKSTRNRGVSSLSYKALTTRNSSSYFIEVLKQKHLTSSDRRSCLLNRGVSSAVWVAFEKTPFWSPVTS